MAVKVINVNERQPESGWRTTIANALIITRREVRDSLRDWRIISPIVILTFLFPFLAQFVAGRFAGFVEGFGAQIIGARMIPFLLMIVGFFPISISLVIALETFVGEKERRSLEPLLSTPLTNTELYIGKTLSAMLPPLISSYGGMTVYLVSLLFGELEWRPPAMLIVQIILVTTVQALVMITGAVVVSSQTTSTRAANLLASFIIIPMTLVIQGESAIMFLAPDADSPNGIGAMWAIIAGMLVVIILLLRVGNAIFNREELLGRTIDLLNLRSTLRKIVRYILAVDEAGTPARNLVDWYRKGVRLSVKRLGYALPITIGVFVLAFVGGVVIGFLPEWNLNLPQNMPLNSVAGSINIPIRISFRRKRHYGDRVAERADSASGGAARHVYIRRGRSDPHAAGVCCARLRPQSSDPCGLQSVVYAGGDHPAWDRRDSGDCAGDRGGAAPRCGHHAPAARLYGRPRVDGHVGRYGQDRARVDPARSADRRLPSKLTLHR
ncbi:MAG: ABC transporter permease [Chloroflexi bacterium]|nr:ABC transporter permease [Chloroflexota bacterium]